MLRRKRVPPADQSSRRPFCMAGRFLLSIILPALMITRCSALVAGSAPRWARRACRAASTTTTTMSTATSNAAAAAADTPPVSLLAGFLGSGKTTLLTNILENREGLRVGVIVNDVAAVNVDALTIRKLLPSANGEVDMIELENGCVCCGPEAGQLAPAVRKLVKTAKARGAPFDQIVIELSGVADPGMVKFHLSKGGVETDRVVTLVDGSAFPSLYHSWDAMGERDDLSGGENIVKADPCVPRRKVVELLVQQLEEADVTVVNKDDIATEDELESTLAVCAALNPKSAVTQTNFGNVPLRSVLSVGEAAVGAAAAGAAVGTQQALAAAAAAEQTFMVKGINCGGCKKALTAALDAVESLEIVSIAHKGETGNAANPVVVKGVAVEAFQAALAELDAGRGKFTIAEEECTNPSCSDPACADHAPPKEEKKKGCADAGCADPDCSGDEHAEHAEAEAAMVIDNPLATENLGIDSFVYTASRPFSEMRIMCDVVDRWPVPIKDTLDIGEVTGSRGAPPPPKLSDSPFEAVIRSKGWVSLDKWPQKGVFWTHAGRHFALEVAPYHKTAETYPVDPERVAKLAAAAADGGGGGDGNAGGGGGGGLQEMVFIGIDMDQAAITAALDDCLLTDLEMEEYELYQERQAESYARFAEQRARRMKGDFDSEGSALRFGVGQRVLAYTGDGPVDGGWSEGTVVAQNYIEMGMDAPAPYQIELDDGGFRIMAPVDDDRVVRSF